MGNHHHLVIETPDGKLSKGVRRVNGVHTQIQGIGTESIWRDLNRRIGLGDERFVERMQAKREGLSKTVGFRWRRNAHPRHRSRTLRHNTRNGTKGLWRTKQRENTATRRTPIPMVCISPPSERFCAKRGYRVDPRLRDPRPSGFKSRPAPGLLVPVHGDSRAFRSNSPGRSRHRFRTGFARFPRLRQTRRSFSCRENVRSR